jgi:hypothetical protein
MLRPIRFDPSHDDAQRAVRRLRQFQETAADGAMRHVSAMIINDGVAYMRELSPRARSVSYGFFHRVYQVFQTVNGIDSDNGYPGARMLVAVGARLRVGDLLRPKMLHLESILRRMGEGSISAEHVV